MEEIQIHLGDWRPTIENECFRVAFSFFDHQALPNGANRKGPGRLFALTEDTLAPGVARHYPTDRKALVFVWPVTGNLTCNGSTLQPGTCAIVPLAKGGALQLEHPAAATEGLVQCLHWWFETNAEETNCSSTIAFAPAEWQNKLRAIIGPDQVNMYIGKYQGRAEDHFRMEKSRAAYVFVLEGVFEVQNRLLHAGDALYLPGQESLEWEALSEDAILIMASF